jgi:hypothetical protein
VASSIPRPGSCLWKATKYRSFHAPRVEDFP